MMPRLPLGALMVTLFIVTGVNARADELKVEAAWGLTSVDRTGATFVTVFNGRGSADRLIGAAPPVAVDVMVHRSFEEGITTKMEHVSTFSSRRDSAWR